MNAHTSPNISAVLAQVAVTVKVRTSSLGLNRLDKDASRKSDMDHNARLGTGKNYASRLSGAEHLVKAINSKAAEFVEAVKAQTTAYGDLRLLANARLAEMAASVKPIKEEWTRMVDDFKANAAQLIADAEFNKGSYNVNAPSLAEIDKAFKLEFELSPIPDSSTYHAAGVTQEVNASMQRMFEGQVQAAYAEAKRDAFARVAKPVAHLIDRLALYQKTEDAKANGSDVKSERLYETTITNVQEIGKVFASFNLDGDPLMDKVALALEAFEGIEIDDIKKSQMLRDDLTKKGEAILETLKDLI